MRSTLNQLLKLLQYYKENKINSWQDFALRYPPYSEISIFKTRNKISFIIPHNKGEPKDFNNRLILFYILLFIAALIFSPLNTSGELSLTNEITIRIVLTIPLTSGISYFLFNYLFSNFGYTQLKIDKNKFLLIYGLFGSKRTIYKQTKNVTQIKTTHDLIAGTRTNTPLVLSKCLIVEGTKQKKFCRYIKRVEKECLVEEINNFLAILVDC